MSRASPYSDEKKESLSEGGNDGIFCMKTKSPDVRDRRQSRREVVA